MGYPCISRNMAEFTNQNQEPISTFYKYPCQMQDIHLTGLKEGEILVSYDPYMIINTNGLVNGMNSDFNQFYYLDKSREVLFIIRLDWKSTCYESEKVVSSVPSSSHPYQNTQKIPSWIKIYSIELIIMVIMMVLVWRILIHEKD